MMWKSRLPEIYTVYRILEFMVAEKILNKEKPYVTFNVLWGETLICEKLVSQVLAWLDFKQKIYQRKSGFLNKKVILFDLEWL